MVGHVADGVDVRLTAFVQVVHDDSAGGRGVDPGRIQPQRARVRAAADGPEHEIGLPHRAVLQVDGVAGSIPLHLRRRRAADRNGSGDECCELLRACMHDQPGCGMWQGRVQLCERAFHTFRRLIGRKPPAACRAERSVAW